MLQEILTVQIENLLFDVHGCVKLCDFGSATTEFVTPDETWSALQRSKLEDEVAFSFLNYLY